MSRGNYDQRLGSIETELHFVYGEYSFHMTAHKLFPSSPFD